MHTPFRTTKFDVVTHMGRRLVFMWSSMPTTKGAWCQRSPISGIPFYLCTHPLCRTELLYTKFHVTWYVGLFLGGQPRSTSKGRGPSAPQFWGFLSVMLLKTTKFDLVTHMWGRSFSTLQFIGFPVFMPAPLNAHDQIRHG